MRPLQILFFLLSVWALAVPTKGSSEASEFVAAVYEHVFFVAQNTTIVPSRMEAMAIIMRNMDIYEVQMKNASKQNASIIVFPEYGLTGFSYTRESFKPFLEDIPDPAKISWNACEDPKTNLSTPVLYRLSCLAKTYKMYLVVNMGDIKLCNRTNDKYCPSDGRYQFNTNVAFDDKGLLVARYHKEHLFLGEFAFVNRPRTPEFITFDTPFGKFGTFTCFDVLFHDPAVVLAKEHNIDHVVFPTAWFDVLPLFAAIGFHSSWARGMRVNYLASNTHVPSVLNTGSGIYAPDGAKEYYRSLSDHGALLVATLQSNPKKIPPSNASFLKPEWNKEMSFSDEESFYSDLFGDLFLFKELRKPEDTVQVCYNGSDTCCSLTYKMAVKRKDEMYAVGVFDGLHTREGQYYLRICALIKCLNLNRTSCGQRDYEASTIFDSFTLSSHLNTPYVYPQVVSDGVSLLPGEWDHDMPVTQLQTKQRLSKGLLTAALFGRVYKKDNSTNVPGGNACALHVPRYALLVGLMLLKVYFCVF